MATLTKPFYHEPYPKGYQQAPNLLEEVMRKYPVDGGRHIVMSRIKTITDRWANGYRSEKDIQEMERYGIVGDYNNKDAGEEPIHYQAN